jgi:V/A-type H+/Na+-transporting ATPase subunit F
MIMPTNDSYQIAVIGPKDLISGLQAVGMKMFPATDAKSAIEAYDTIQASDLSFACVCITEGIMNQFDQETKEYITKQNLPVILTIPDLRSDKNAGLDKLRELTKRAIGSDIFSNN